jgi:solute carrier family 24 (sodium/potassium/calcium exchanger), member 6
VSSRYVLLLEVFISNDARLFQTAGLIFGLSDAIVGLTIFAVGNSLADLVANMSVAAFAPIMGFSACFGAPMLNILLGIGVSGSVVMHETGQNYTLHFSPTLLVSSVGLLALLIATLIFVPWNGYLLSRKWGIFLLVSYLIIMLVTVLVEVNKS